MTRLADSLLMYVNWPESENLQVTNPFKHMARFSELALAFVVEQAGWNNDWR